MFHPLAFLKGAGLGAGMMYFFDPVSGNRRQALLRDQLVSTVTTFTRQAEATCRDASNRLQGAGAEIRSAMQSTDQPLTERVREGAMEAGRTLGRQGSSWSPTAKAAAMLGGASLIASFMSKRDLAALAFGAVGLTFMAKELTDQQNMRGRAERQSSGQQRDQYGRQANPQGESSQREQGEQKAGDQNKSSQSVESNEGAGIEASVPTEKKAIHNL